MKGTKSLNEAIAQNFMIRTSDDNSIYNAYWRFCKKDHRPFVAITRKGGNELATIVLDMFPTSRNLNLDILKQIDEQIDLASGKNIWRWTNLERSLARVRADRAEDLARQIFDFALISESRS